MTSAWPDLPAATSPGMTVRDQLDYLVWVAEAMEPLGFRGTGELEPWRGRVQRAYGALVDSMAPGHGDSLPPDVPPALRPGTWPDVAAASIAGMTVRHQLAVVRRVAEATRADRQFPRLPADVATWTARVQTAYDALDHGPLLEMPASARSEPPPPPPPPPGRKGRAGGKAARAKKASAGERAAKPKAKAKKPARKR